jgi:hypothetical protein
MDLSIAYPCYFIMVFGRNYDHSLIALFRYLSNIPNTFHDILLCSHRHCYIHILDIRIPQNTMAYLYYGILWCMNQEIQEVKENTRYAKAQRIAKMGHIHQFQEERNRWLVQSESDKKRYYMVTVDKDFECCTCPDSQIRGNICKHLLAVCVRYSRVV